MATRRSLLRSLHRASSTSAAQQFAAAAAAVAGLPRPPGPEAAATEAAAAAAAAAAVAGDLTAAGQRERSPVHHLSRLQNRSANTQHHALGQAHTRNGLVPQQQTPSFSSSPLSSPLFSAAAADSSVPAEAAAAAAAAAAEAPAPPVSASAARPLYPGSGVDNGGVVIVGAARTAIGSFQGSLARFSAPQLGAAAIAGALAKAGLNAEAVEEVVMGNVLCAGVGQAPARQAALIAGLPETSVCTTVNKVCSSGLKAIAMGAQSIALGMHGVVVAGGMESMSHAPYLLPRSLNARRHGDLPLKDTLVWDGLWDPHLACHMGMLAEQCSEEMRISRDDQDEEAISSYQKALSAGATGRLAHEIVPVLPVLQQHWQRQMQLNEQQQGRRGKGKVSAAQAAALTWGGGAGGRSGKGPAEDLMHDEECTKFDPDKLRLLPPAFSPDGPITAGNASSLADGAAAVVLTSAAYAAEHGLPIIARVLGYADAEQAPDRFPTSPALAIPRALKSAGLGIGDAELFEINEAFAAVTLANERLLGLAKEQLNIHGGAVALGHPIGASGARIVVALANALGVTGEDIGVAAACNGGGGASAIVLQREPSFHVSDHPHHHHHSHHSLEDKLAMS